MKPFVAIAVLVAASLSAASAAPSLQQQVARGSQAGRLGQTPSLSGGFQLPSGSPGLGSLGYPGGAFSGQVSAGFPGHPAWSVGGGVGHFPSGAFGAASSGSPSSSAAGAASRPGSAAVGSVQGQIFQGGNSVFGAYPGVPSLGYYAFSGPNYYPAYGNGAGWAQVPAYGGSLWGVNGNGYGYGGFFPADVGQVSYGTWGAPSFGGVAGPQGAGQRLAAQGGRRASRAGSASSQSQARRQ